MKKKSEIERHRRRDALIASVAQEASVSTPVDVASIEVLRDELLKLRIDIEQLRADHETLRAEIRALQAMLTTIPAGAPPGAIIA